MKSEKTPEPPNWSQMDVTSPQFRLACSQIANDLAANWKFKVEILFAVFALIVAVAAVIFGFIGVSIKDQARAMQDELRREIAITMKQPEIQQIIREVAEKESATLLRRTVQPTIDRFELNVSAREKEINEIAFDLQKQPISVGSKPDGLNPSMLKIWEELNKAPTPTPTPTPKKPQD